MASGLEINIISFDAPASDTRHRQDVQRLLWNDCTGCRKSSTHLGGRGLCLYGADGSLGAWEEEEEEGEGGSFALFSLESECRGGEGVVPSFLHNAVRLSRASESAIWDVLYGPICWPSRRKNCGRSWESSPFVRARQWW